MASQIVSNHDVLHISFYKARKMALITAISGAVPLIDRIELLVIPGLFWYGTARAIHFISISCICLALYYYAEDMDKRNRNIAYALMLPCVIWIFRTSIMGTACAMAFFAFFRNGYKSLFKIVAIGLALLIFLFSLPSMQKKMFRGEARFSIESLFAGEISKENIDSNGRFRMWEEAERKFYEGNKLTGSGSGVLQSFMYSQGKEEFHGAKIIHNDYIQMKCDNGLIGFWLFLLTELSMVVHCMLVFRQSDDRWIKICALSAGSSMAGVALTLISDNVVNYSMATLSYPFILYGSMLGLMHNQEDQ
ncbi:MAG: O-antigen ligase family protein [Bacteroidales bacterium]|nr:O-antigen ligase family protein [Bacteroidales bacterium]